jgi:hypothetical protein
MQTRFHPWRRLRDLGPTWQLRWSEDLPWDTYGFTDYSRRRIVLRSGMTFEERRSTITHEVEHVLRGPFSRCEELREEAEVNRRCARLLLPSMQDLADALVWHDSDYEAAAEDLWVDPWTLEVRLGTLRPLERDYLQSRLADVILRSP